jgi:D-alanyl-D-alanine carboxypeptidase/D-alanyl-D-alanine-endopeptidase (penicillin-binding protein 4)
MQPKQRRFFVPTVLAVIALLLFWAAAQAGSGVPAAEGSSRPPKGPTTPLLSARRLAPYLVAPIADSALHDQLDEVVADSPSDTCLTVSVGGRVLYEHHPDAPMTPASTEKLVTSVAALDVLGQDTRFRTRVVATGEPSDGVIDGDLFLVGGGDPLLATKGYAEHFRNQPQIRTSLEDLADRVVKAGVHQVKGRVVGDESRYDSDRYPDAWPARYAEQSQVGPLSALSVNDAFQSWPEHQSREGTVESTPAADPPVYAAQQLIDLLRARGVTVSGGAAAGTAPKDAEQIAAIDSVPMRKVVDQLVTESDNQTAELLVKEMGRKAGGAPTTAAGVAVVTRTMEKLHLARPGTHAADGSGLDEHNRVSCRLLMNILDQGGPKGVLASGLAIAGKTGTLADRFLESPARERLRAKTGTLNTVTALTGFVNAQQGPVLTFAYIANGEYVNDQLLKLQETLGGDLVVYPQGPALKAVGPQ